MFQWITNKFSPPKLTVEKPNTPKADPLWALVSSTKENYQRLYVETIKILLRNDYPTATHRERYQAAHQSQMEHVLNAMKVRRVFILPSNTPAEDIHLEADMWTYAVFYVALIQARHMTMLPLDRPLDYLSPTARNWLNPTLQDAITNYLDEGAGPLKPVFLKLAKLPLKPTETPKEEQPSEDNVPGAPSSTEEQICEYQNNTPPNAATSSPVEPPLLDLVPALVNYVNDVAANGDINTSPLLPHNGLLLFSLSAFDEIISRHAPHLTPERLEQKLHNISGGPAGTFYNTITQDYIRGYLAPISVSTNDGVQNGMDTETIAIPAEHVLNRYLQNKTLLRTTSLSKTVHEIASSLKQPIDRNLAHSLIFIKEIIRSIAFSDTIYSLKGPESLVYPTKNGVFIRWSIWEEISSHLEIPPKELEQAWPELRDYPTFQRPICNQTICQMKGLESFWAMHILDGHYSSQLIPTLAHRLRPLEQWDIDLLVAALKRFVKAYSSALHRSKFVGLYRVNHELFISAKALTTFAKSEGILITSGKDLVNVFCTHLTDFGARPSTAIHDLQGLQGFALKPFYARSLKHLPKATNPRPIESLDPEFVIDQLIQCFGPSPQSLSFDSIHQFNREQLKTTMRLSKFIRYLNDQFESAGLPFTVLDKTQTVEY